MKIRVHCNPDTAEAYRRELIARGFDFPVVMAIRETDETRQVLFSYVGNVNNRVIGRVIEEKDPETGEVDGYIVRYDGTIVEEAPELPFKEVLA